MIEFMIECYIEHLTKALWIDVNPKTNVKRIKAHVGRLPLGKNLQLLQFSDPIGAKQHEQILLPGSETGTTARYQHNKPQIYVKVNGDIQTVRTVQTANHLESTKIECLKSQSILAVLLMYLPELYPLYIGIRNDTATGANGVTQRSGVDQAWPRIRHEGVLSCWCDTWWKSLSIGQYDCP